jgi:hypothetical protein
MVALVAVLVLLQEQVRVILHLLAHLKVSTVELEMQVTLAVAVELVRWVLPATEAPLAQVVLD